MRRMWLLTQQAMRAHPLVVDTVLAVLVAGMAYLGRGDLVALMTGLPLVLRRHAPVAVLVMCEAAVIADRALGFGSSLVQVGPLVALATVASLRPRRWAAVGATLIAVGPLISGPRMGDLIALNAVWTLTAWALGDGLRRLARYRAMLAENSEHLHNEHHRRLRRAVLEERVRIARELHDIVAHHMSVIAVQAGLARYVFTADPATALQALDAITTMSTEGMAEVRRLVAVLRPDPPAAPEGQVDQQTPNIDQLPAMIERIGFTGVPIEFTIIGEPRPLPAGVGQCVYRVVQESLTNVVKHARAARTTVCLRYLADKIAVRVTDDGQRVGGQRTIEGLGETGTGLIGMRERALLYGGSLTAGPLPSGGFEVVLTVPNRGTETV